MDGEHLILVTVRAPGKPDYQATLRAETTEEASKLLKGKAWVEEGKVAAAALEARGA